MVRPRTYKTEAIVLRQLPLGEADRILTLFTPDEGKLRAVAKGVRRTKSKLGGHLELLNCVSLSLALGRDLDVVTEAQTVHSFKELRDDLPRLSKGLYLAELVDSFSAENLANYPLYLLLVDSLGRLQQVSQPDLLLRYFELRLLEHTGFRPEVFVCVICRSRLEPGDHLFSPAQGGVLCPQCRTQSVQAGVTLSLDAMKVVRFLLREDEYTKAAGIKVSAALLGEVTRLSRTYIRFVLERELKSVAFMDLVASTVTRATPD